jgi:hypothetical protein
MDEEIGEPVLCSNTAGYGIEKMKQFGE